MNAHNNARLTPLGREHIVRQMLSGADAEGGQPSGRRLPTRTVRKWVARHRAEGQAGLNDRSSRPQLRSQRWTGKQIAATLGVSPATVSRILRRLSENTPEIQSRISD